VLTDDGALMLSVSRKEPYLEVQLRRSKMFILFAERPEPMDEFMQEQGLPCRSNDMLTVERLCHEFVTSGIFRGSLYRLLALLSAKPFPKKKKKK
jgi:hypothetical protein